MVSPLRITLIVLALACLALHDNSSLARLDDATRTQTATAVSTDEAEFAIPEHEKPFWESAKAFLNAFTARDAKAIGELFTEDAELFDEFGERTNGRAEIVALYEDVFASASTATIEEITIERVRAISESVSLEEGIVISSEVEGGPRHSSRYVALHQREADGRWRINTLKSYPREDLDERTEQIGKLSWLLGEWVNENEGEVVRTECAWSEDGNYLLRKFTVHLLGRPAMDGVQRLGWDPVRKQIRSWTFDSRGGFFDGYWSQNGDDWQVTISGVTADGEAVSGLAVYRLIDEELIHWQYRYLTVGEELREDSPVIVMVRPAPAPKSTSN